MLLPSSLARTLLLNWKDYSVIITVNSVPSKRTWVCTYKEFLTQTAGKGD